MAQLEKHLDRAVDASLQQCWQSLDLLDKRLSLQSPEVKIANEKRALEQLALRLNNVRTNYFSGRATALDSLEKRLLALNPENVMKRGYAFVRRNEKVITSAADLNTGDRIDIRFVDGERSAITE